MKGAGSIPYSGKFSRENIFANQNLSTKFAKIFSRKNFPLYSMFYICNV